MGTERVTRDGYVRVKTADRGWMYRAQLSAEQELGRRLQPGERVTHGPGGVGDDRPKNLRLQSTALLEVAIAEGTVRAKAARTRGSAMLGPGGGRVRKPRRIISVAVDPELHARLKVGAEAMGETLPKLAVSLLCWTLIGGGRGQLAAIPISCAHKLTNDGEVDS